MGKLVKIYRKTLPIVWLTYFFLMIGVVGFLGAYLTAAPFFLMGYLFSPLRRFGDAIMRWGIWLLLYLQPWMKARVLIETPQLKPGQSCLFVSNHRSTLDTFIVLAHITGVRIMAKKSLFSNPFLGPIMRLCNHIPARLKDPSSFTTAVARLREMMIEGETVYVFPEFSRCPQGMKGMLKFSLTPFILAQERQIPIVPVAITGTDDVWPRDFWGIHGRRPIRVESLAPIEPDPTLTPLALRRLAQSRISDAINQWS
jgi:1-acyl-sn-glycerol-3-phosphate acyltransferase